MTVAEKIKIARERAGLTQPELAKIVGTTKQNIYKYEKGIITNIPLTRIEKIADALGVSVGWLLGWERPEQAEAVDDLTDMQKRLIAAVKKMTPEQQEAWLRVLETQT